MKCLVFAATAAAVVCATTNAATVQVQATSQIDGRYANAWFNANSPLVGVQVGDTVTMTFTVDSGNYTNGTLDPNYRGYAINPGSFSLTMGSTTVALMNPYPALAGTPMFVLRNNVPGVDGFSLANNPDPGSDSTYLNAAGQFENYSNVFNLSYEGNTISSLDILSALGTYTWEGMQQPQWYINDGFATRLEMYSFSQMTISQIPAPAAFGAFAPAMLLAVRRRRAN